MELTDAGATFLERARALLEDVERACASTKRTARGEQGRVVVGFTSSAPFHPFIPRVLREFREMSPLVSLALEESGSSELVQALHDEKIDAAFIRSPVEDFVDLTVEPLLEEEMLVALPAGHRSGGSRRRSNQAPLALTALASEDFLLYKRPGAPGLYDTIISACRKAGFSPKIRQEAPRIVSTLNLVAVGLGISIVPDSLRRLQMDGVTYRRIAGSAKLSAPLILACRRGGNSAAVQRFIDLVRASARQIDESAAPLRAPDCRSAMSSASSSACS